MQLLLKLRADYPNIVFTEGDSFFWSPLTNTVTYSSHTSTQPKIAEWALLHEVSHAILRHDHYHSDFELVKLEVEAWTYAKKLAKSYNIFIDYEHIENCLDTYRDWLHKRSMCPSCKTISTQLSSNVYQCINCMMKWSVTNSRFCRPYRRSFSKNVTTKKLG
jgi:hypothetical protein